MGGVPDDRATQTPSDAALARRAALGDRSAFAVLVDRHGPALYRYVRRLVAGDDEAADCMQETFLAAWTALPRFRAESSVRTWLFGIATRQARRSRTRAYRRAEDPLTDRPETPARTGDPASSAVASGLLAALDAGLRRLPEPQRACWILREIEGLSYDEIASVLGTSAGSVRGSLHRARTALGAMLEGWR